MRFYFFRSKLELCIARSIVVLFIQLSQLALGELEKDPSKLQEEMLEEIIRKGESNTLEFKSSMRSPSQADLAIIPIEKSLEKATGQDEKHSLQRKLTDLKKTLMNALEHKILKTIAAFMNSEGGTLVVGVNDGGNVVGLDKDFQTFSGKKTGMTGLNILSTP